MHLHRLIKTNAASAPRNSVSNHSRPSRTRARRFTLSALSVAVLALALIITGMLTTDSADAQMTNTTTIWSATMTVESSILGPIDRRGFANNPSHGSLSSTQFTYDGTSYSIVLLRTEKTTVSGSVTSDVLNLQPSPIFPTTADSKLVLELDGTEFALADATRQTNFYAWSSHGLTWAENQSVTVKLTTSDPGVSSIALTSDPNDDSRTGNDDTYAIGDDIEATLTFNQAVDVTGSPQITLTIGSSEKAASCAAATNTTTVVCSYEVAQGNNAPDGVGVKANSLVLNGGTIHKESSTTDNAFLGHAAVAVNASHKVDGIRPTLITTGADAPRISTDGTQAFLRFSEALSSTDTLDLSINISTAGVDVTGAVTSATINNGDRVTVTHNGVVSADSTLTLLIRRMSVTDLVGNSFDQRRQVPITNTARAPVAPTDLTASAASTTRINLSWSAPSDAAETGVTGYQIEVSVDTGDNWTVLVADTNSTDTRYAHTGLDPDDARHYRVSAINPVGTSPESNVASATTLLVNPVISSGEGTLFVANTAGGNNPGEPISHQTIPRRAQAFTTGPAGAGYVLGSIGVSFQQIASSSTAGAELEVTLNEQDSNGDPGAALCTLKDPAAFDDYALNTFTAPTTGDAICPVLQGSTTYFVVVERSSGQSNIQLTQTTRDSEDSQADRTRWSIANESLRHIGTPKTWQTRSGVFKLQVRGAYVPSLTAIGAIADESGDPDVSTTMTFQIFLDHKLKHNVFVDYATQDGTAQAGVNYTHTSGTVTFAPREQVKTVDVDILDDGEGGSTYFNLVLSNPKGAGLRANHPGTGRILDTLQLFRTWDASAREGNTTISFVVEFNHREPGDTADYTVDYRTEDITATAGADYVSTSGTLTFTPADGDLVVPVTIKDDDIQDNGETFRLVLSNPSSGVTLHRTAATAIGTILNHDSEGLTATFPASAYASKSHKGPNDRPQVVVAFNSSVASISATTPSVVW